MYDYLLTILQASSCIHLLSNIPYRVHESLKVLCKVPNFTCTRETYKMRLNNMKHFKQKHNPFEKHGACTCCHTHWQRPSSCGSNLDDGCSLIPCDTLCGHMTLLVTLKKIRNLWKAWKSSKHLTKWAKFRHSFWVDTFNWVACGCKNWTLEICFQKRLNYIFENSHLL